MYKFTEYATSIPKLFFHNTEVANQHIYNIPLMIIRISYI